MNKIVYLSFLIAIASHSGVNAQALPGNWPPPDAAPPVNNEWSNTVRNLPAKTAQVVTTCQQQGDWALTYDDGPTLVTNQVLDALQRANMKATFFVVGSRVLQNAAILKKAYEAGHQIALHSFSHANYGSLSEDQIVADATWNMKAVYDAIGVYPKYFRVPLGSSSPTVLSVLGKLGMTLVSWNRDTNDWRAVQDRSFDIRWVTGNFSQWVTERTPSISLQHDLYELTVGPVPETLRMLSQNRFNVKTVAECLGDSSPYMNSFPNLSGAPRNESNGNSNLRPNSNTGNGENGVKSSAVKMVFGISMATFIMSMFF